LNFVGDSADILAIEAEAASLNVERLAALRSALARAQAISRRYEGQEAALWSGWIEAQRASPAQIPTSTPTMLGEIAAGSGNGCADAVDGVRPLAER
jgi:hypothetical protein